MNIDHDEFDRRQHAFCRFIAKGVREILAEHEIEEGLIQQLTEDLSFGICAQIDGSQIMEEGELSVLPKLCFYRREGDDLEHLITCEGTSWMHEYAIGMAESLFEEDEEEDAQRSEQKNTDSINSEIETGNTQTQSGKFTEDPKATYSILFEFSNGLKLSCYYFPVMGPDFLIHELIQRFYFAIDPDDHIVKRYQDLPVSRISNLFQNVDKSTLLNESTQDMLEVKMDNMDQKSILELADIILSQ